MPVAVSGPLFVTFSSPSNRSSFGNLWVDSSGEFEIRCEVVAQLGRISHGHDEEERRLFGEGIQRARLKITQTFFESRFRQVLLAVISVVQCRVPPFRQVRVGVIVLREKNSSSAKVSLVRAEGRWKMMSCGPENTVSVSIS